MVGLVAAAMSTAEFNRARLAERAGQNWITVTALADTLARDHDDVPFTKSHEVAKRLVAESLRRPDRPLERLLAEVSAEVLGRAVEYGPAEPAEVLTAQHFVRVRTTPGGPAPSETARAHAVSLTLLAADQAWLGDTVGRLRAAEGRLDQAAASL